MYNYNVIVCGCTKNSASYIRAHLNRLYTIKEAFKNVQIVVYENDSADQTARILEEFKNMHDSFEYISENGVDRHFCNRPERIAHGRNRLLEYIRQSKSNFDYMIMVDLDSVLELYHNDQLKELFTHDVNTWDVLTSNCVGRYYDIWALRINHSIWDSSIHGTLWASPVDYDCWVKVRFFGNTKKYIADNQIQIPAKTPLIPVNSAFGGFGIYKMSSIQGCVYNANVANTVTCEHVEFHRQLQEKNQARIFICPSFIVQGQPEHLVVL